MRCNATVKTKTACLLLKLSQMNNARAQMQQPLRDAQSDNS